MSDFKTTGGVSVDVGEPLPISLGDCTDAYAQIKALRIEIEHKAEEVKKRENEIQEHIIASLKLEGKPGAVGTFFTSKLKPSRKPVIEDWNNFTAWVIRTGQTQVLYKRVNEKAIGEMEEANAELPEGMSFKVDDKLSITKT